MGQDHPERMIAGMQRARYLTSDDLQDNQILETDIMRFVAVIGIVFWIIFAIIKSIPFQTSANNSPPVRQTRREKTVPESPGPPAILEEKKVDHPVQFQFRSLDDLISLLAAGRVRIFCRARTNGFDLLFEGIIKKGDKVNFRNTRDLPQKLWEIRSGKDHAYFMDLIAATYPSIHSFPTKEVFVAFTDKKIENSIERMLVRLKQAKQNGVISITRTGEVVCASLRD